MLRVGWHAAKSALLLCCLLVLAGATDPPAIPGHVLDEARQAGRNAASLPAATEDYFHDMDGGVTLTKDQATGLDPVLGRNMWLVWSGGNDRFWDSMSRPTFGGFDLLKIVAPDPNGPNRRDNRWSQLGMVNEPCFSAPSRPDRYGLWRDLRDPACAPDPFADAAKYPGVKIGARGTTVPVGSY